MKIIIYILFYPIAKIFLLLAICFDFLSIKLNWLINNLRS